MRINKDELKEDLTINDICLITSYFEGDPVPNGTGLTLKTICHNHPKDNPSRKLYYYKNTHLFKCFTQCQDTFDIFELVIKCFKIQKKQEIDLPQAITFILNKLGKSAVSFMSKENINDSDDYLNIIIDKYKDLEDYSFDTKDFKEYEDNLIKNLPCLRIEDWENEGISYNTLQKYNIRYYIPSAQIVIPHYDINNKLIGIRGRLMIEEDIERYGKYMPLIASGRMYNHPLGFNLYGININKENIIKAKTIILFEGEKSVLKAEEILENNISVAVCGSTISNRQMDEVLLLGVTEVIIAFDRQYKVYGDNKECVDWHDKINKLVCKYKSYFNISVIFDTENLLGYKDSPVDCGAETFFELLRTRKVAV